MPFPCPACEATVARSPAAWWLRCRSCGAFLRSRAVESGGRTSAYDVTAVGRAASPRRVEVAWDDHQQRRLEVWLLWSSVVTLGLVGVLLVLAWLLP